MKLQRQTIITANKSLIRRKTPLESTLKGQIGVCISSTFSGLLRPILSMNQYCLSEYQEALCQS